MKVTPHQIASMEVASSGRSPTPLARYAIIGLDAAWHLVEERQEIDSNGRKGPLLNTAVRPDGMKVSLVPPIRAFNPSLLASVTPPRARELIASLLPYDPEDEWR